MAQAFTGRNLLSKSLLRPLEGTQGCCTLPAVGVLRQEDGCLPLLQFPIWWLSLLE